VHNAFDPRALSEDLAEFGLTEDQVELVIAWHLVTAKRLAYTAGGAVARRLLAYLLDGHRDASLPLRVAGVVHGLGFRTMVQHRTLEEHADALGVSRHALQAAAAQAKRAIMAE
jgi:hypothetical protein